MNKIQVLDCTLRDGGYCNQFCFGYDNIKKIISNLTEANIDIIECGFLTNTVEYEKEKTLFNNVDQISGVIPKKHQRKMIVALMNYGQFDVDTLPEYTENSIDGIRVAFHKKNREEALKVCEKIKSKGYKVFVQAMVSISYTDKEFLDLIHKVNKLDPYAFYIVDSFGTMKGKDLTRLFYIIEHNLNDNIIIGLHSHNNLQLSFSNAQTLLGIQTNRRLIIDSSIYGMGRGAGNLNTELFVEYLNELTDCSYKLNPLLRVIDEILNDFYNKSHWGYSLPNYLSATHNAHPNYARFLDDKKTLAVKDMNEIFSMMEDEKKVSFDKNYIEELYLRYMESGVVHEEHRAELSEKVAGKKVILIAPGRSSSDEKEKIIDASKSNDVITVSINFDYSHLNVDYIFSSNIRRFKALGKEQREKCIVTSNIAADNVYLQTGYSDLLNDEESVSDNAGLMAIKFFIDCGAKEILLAGFDGYSKYTSENYGESGMEIITRNAVLDAMNLGMTNVISEYARKIDISFVTKPKYIVISGR